MYYKLILDGGHVGAGKSHTFVRYFKGRDMVTVMRNALKMPRLKRRGTLDAIKEITQISRQEYLEGIKREKMDRYLAVRA